jgi:5-methyltetrahydrofolate--homocysteine methyltransferase
MSEHETLFKAICNGDRATVVRIVQAAVDRGEDVGHLLSTTMIPAMGEVGERFSRNDIFVPEMLVAARAMQGGLALIEPILARSGHEPRGRVGIGSVKGDLHDIGKNLVAMMLKGAGFAVEDLGVDVDVQEFEGAVQRGAQVLCLSALLTTTKHEMRTVVDHFRGRAGVKIVVGGAVVTQDYAHEIGADDFGADATDAVRAVKRCLGIAD